MVYNKTLIKQIYLLLIIVALSSLCDEHNAPKGSNTLSTIQPLSLPNVKSTAGSENLADSKIDITVYYLKKVGLFEFREQDSQAPKIHLEYHKVIYNKRGKIISWSRYKKINETDPPPGELLQYERYKFSPKGVYSQRQIINVPYEWIIEQYYMYPDGENIQKIIHSRSANIVDKESYFYEDGFLFKELIYGLDSKYTINRFDNGRHPLKRGEYHVENYNGHNSSKKKNGIWMKKFPPPCSGKRQIEQIWSKGVLKQFARAEKYHGKMYWRLYKLKSFEEDNTISDLGRYWNLIRDWKLNIDCQTN